MYDTEWWIMRISSYPATQKSAGGRGGGSDPERSLVIHHSSSHQILKDGRGWAERAGISAQRVS